MAEWTNLSANLFEADVPQVSTLVNLIGGLLPQDITPNEPFHLFKMRNSGSFASQGNSGGGEYFSSPSWNTFIRHWAAGWVCDGKASFAWGLGDTIDPVTYETDSLYFNPHVDIYGYLSGYLTLFNPYGMISLSGIVTPFDTHLIDFNVSVPTAAPADLCLELSFIT